VGVPEENLTLLKSAKLDGAVVGKRWRQCRRKDRLQNGGGKLPSYGLVGVGMPEDNLT